jgi:2-C-methyl-D-erythritol 4-phosphate cytidylyltransferase/2-C-methyl-D-erythritol 2,4-cyclodiphosphate synthase
MPESYHVLVVAAGRGSRAGAGLPKQFRPLAGRSLIARTLETFLQRPDIASVIPVIHADDTDLFARATSTIETDGIDRLGAPAFGGATRQESVHAGLEALARRLGRKSDIVLIHDGARPFASTALIGRAIEGARSFGAAVPGCPVFDTVKQIGEGGRIVGTPDRSRLRAVQTPQAFTLDLILDAHRRARADGRHDLTDDAAVAEYAGHDVFVFEGEPGNAKITTWEDFQAAELKLMSTLLDVRTGQGFDVHAFTDGDHVWLGGIRIDHTKALSGHSDADVVLHALTDAILGAIGDGDIGSHFPPSQARWKGAASDIFLRHAVQRVHQRGGMIAHLNATVVCELPKIGPHREAMRASIAAIAGLTLDRVAVTATTSERLGFTGRGEGIAAWGLATLRLPLVRS